MRPSTHLSPQAFGGMRIELLDRDLDQRGIPLCGVQHRLILKGMLLMDTKAIAAKEQSKAA